MKLNKMVFDDKKIEAAANKHIETEYARYNTESKRYIVYRKIKAL